MTTTFDVSTENNKVLLLINELDYTMLNELMETLHNLHISRISDFQELINESLSHNIETNQGSVKKNLETMKAMNKLFLTIARCDELLGVTAPKIANSTL